MLTLFGKSFELTGEGKYPSEGTVHDIIFPRKGDSFATDLEDHNLWIIDERLNFTSFVSSDKPLDGGKSDRPDVLVFDKAVLFRGDNQARNPITIFEVERSLCGSCDAETSQSLNGRNGLRHQGPIPRFTCAESFVIYSASYGSNLPNKFDRP